MAVRFDIDRLGEEVFPFSSELDKVTAEVKLLLEPESDYVPEYNPLDRALYILESDIGSHHGFRGEERVADILTDQPDELLGMYRKLEPFVQQVMNSKDTAGWPTAYRNQWTRDVAEGLKEFTYQLEQASSYR